MTTESLTHVYFVLDRSGSMDSIASDVIGGFNGYVASQRDGDNDVLLTLIQFDTQNSHDVVLNAVPIAEVPELTSAIYVPRGSTPLYDAMGHAIADATIRLEQVGAEKEEIIVVTFTDGEENSSSEYDRERIFKLIDKKKEAGWTFVFLGANQDAYLAGGRMGFTDANVQNFSADAQGTDIAFKNLSRSTSVRRMKKKDGTLYRPDDFFEGDKAADEDFGSRSAK